jgi:hypothetical protein
MVNIANNLIMETTKPIEIVYQLKTENETPTFEEFMKAYQEDERITDSYCFEVDN